MNRTLIFVAVSMTLASAAAAPPEVAVVRPAEREIADQEEFVGRTDASTTVEIRSRVTGIIEKILFEEGAQVQQGAVLVQLDDRTQKAELEKAQAEVVQAEAKLKQAEVEYQRAKRLEQLKGVAKEDVEFAAATMDAAKAATMAARAGLEVARLKLESTRIIAPRSGRIGRRLVDEGNIVKADGDTLLASIVVVDPLYVYFDVDERNLLRLMRLMRDSKDAKAAVTVSFPADAKLTRQGVVNFVDNKVNAEKIRVRAVLANPKTELVPGLSATVRLTLGPPRKVLLVPESAVSFTEDGAFVFVVNKQDTLEKRKVGVWRAVGASIAIETGLKTEDRVARQVTGRKDGEEIKPRQEKEHPATKPDSLGSQPQPLPDLPGNGPALIVSASYAGADPNTVEETVAGPIAEQLRGLEGLRRVLTTCNEVGEMRMTLLMNKGTDLNAALVLARDRIAKAQPLLPDIVSRLGVTVKKRQVHLLNVAVLSDDPSNREAIGAIAEKTVRDELLRVAGVADVTIHGNTGPRQQVRVNIDRDRLRALGLTAKDIMDALDAEVGPPKARPDFVVGGRAKNIEEMGDLVVKNAGGGQLIRLKDVARLELVSGWATLTKVDGKPCVVLQLSRMADADAGDTANAVSAYLDKLAKSLPAGIVLRVIDAEK